MGHRMSDVPHIYGNNCSRGANLTLPLWPLTETPKYVYIRFSGIQKCPTERCLGGPLPPNDRVFKLTQSEFDPCHWDYFGDWEVHWRLLAGLPTHVWFALLWPPLNAYYFHADFETNGYNARFATNQFNCTPFNSCGVGGIAVVRWVQEATNLLEAINMKRADDLFMEMHPLVDGNLVYKFCRLRDATNIAIEYEP